MELGVFPPWLLPGPAGEVDGRGLSPHENTYHARNKLESYSFYILYTYITLYILLKNYEKTLHAFTSELRW
jgi:hypothetical protein